MEHNIGKLFNMLVRDRGYDPTIFKQHLTDFYGSNNEGQELLYKDAMSGLGKIIETGVVPYNYKDEHRGLLKLYRILKGMDESDV